MSKHLQETLTTLTTHQETPILCVGDVMLDAFVTGTVERTSPEAPIPILHHSHVLQQLGGAGNVIRNMASLGAQTHLFSVTGYDATHSKIETLFEEIPNAQATLMQEAGRVTTEKTRFTSAGQQLLRVDKETSTPLSEKTQQKLLEAIEPYLSKTKVLVLSDYAKGVLTSSLLKELIERAQRKGIFVVCDPKGTDYSCYKGANLLTPNLKELSATVENKITSQKDLISAATLLCKKHGIGALLVTQSEQGMTLVTATGGATHIPSEAREVFDVSGAGDTVVATIACAYNAGVPLEQAVPLANTAAGVVISKAGTATIASEELSRALWEEHHHQTDQKLCTLSQVQELSSKWQRQNKTIGLTNGCFDLLHSGHIYSLQQAKKHCDKLIVALNNDASIRRLKGPDRPIQDEETRALVLASLEIIAGVIIF